MFPRPLSEAPESVVRALARWTDLVDHEACPWSIGDPEIPVAATSLLVDFCPSRFSFIVMCHDQASVEWLKLNERRIIRALIAAPDGPEAAGWGGDNYDLVVITCTEAEMELSRELLAVRLELANLLRGQQKSVS